jgi:hypothetical protein
VASPPKRRWRPHVERNKNGQEHRPANSNARQR